MPKMGKKRVKEQNEDSSEDEDAVAQALAAHGEAFLSMFDDYDEERAAKRRQQEAVREQQQQQQHPHGGINEPSDADGDNSSDEEGLDGSEHKDGEEAGLGPSSIEQLLYSGRKGLGSLQQLKAKGGADAKAAAHQNGKPRVKQQQQQQQPGHGAGAKAAQQLQQQQQQQRDLEMSRRARKAFMSAKASQVFGEDEVEGDGGRGHKGGADEDEDDAGMSREEFQKMAREVEMFGASALDKRSFKSWRAAMLARIGASADKAPRTAAKIGKGMAKASRERDKKALEEAIAAGMAQRKGRGQKLRAMAAKQRDKGLMEAGSAFKNGVLRADRLMKAAGKPGAGGVRKGGAKGSAKGGHKRQR